MLVVTEEEALPAEALVAAHHVDAGLLAPTVALRALVQVCRGKVAGGEHSCLAHPGHRDRVGQICWVVTYCCLTSVIPQLEERGMLDGAGDEGKAQQECVQGSYSFPGSWPHFTEGNTRPQRKGFSLSQKPQSTQDAHPGCWLQLAPAPSPSEPVASWGCLHFIRRSWETLAQSRDNYL